MEMVIGICDDDERWRQESQKMLVNFAEMTHIDMEVLCFSTAEELLECKESALDAVFLDIELGRQLGISVAKRLNKIRPNCKIIYMTNYLHYATEVYNTEHIWFVVKKQFQDKLGEMINRILREFENRKAQIVVKTMKSECIVITSSDICYMEKEKRGTKIVTVWEEYHVKDRLSEIIPQLSELDFSQCHSSYVVNFHYVKEIQKDVYLLRGQFEKEQIVQISRRYVQKTREDFLKWSALYV